ncbi:DNA repair and recombination protein RAD26 [Galdieria sulphuraria]|uniref:DNA repair and recombination protein RAD26 n=1 Tax=Galdieria sulphuraria TaxID=130081 RepID=M2XDK5_GALSU|nr:DNA repair and recombination protein RAD26 [Galdieria sulphuraria]EME28072.1 DNA repair and recombination protein RAD26 [Galdieria sulphuraria]|eukprot:XP_005704592.1 DNA repair and recombination protein RAD26 [Galdieria sulphuraria]
MQSLSNEAKKRKAPRLKVPMLKGVAATIPPKYEYTLFVPLTGLQRHLYLQTLKGMNFLSGQKRMSHFLAIYILCLICSIPGVLRTYLEHKYNDCDEGQIRNSEDWFDAPDFLPLKKTLEATTSKEYLQTLYSVLSFPLNELASLSLDSFETDPFQSFKLLVLLELVSHSLELNEKIIIFTRSIPLLESIVNFLNLYISSNRDSIGIDSFDGRTPIFRRRHLIEQFNEPDSPLKVLVLSTGTGGEGISLAAASRVIIFDCSWNPSHDMQAACRAYRYGQTKPVFVYRLVTKNTVEEKMYSLGRNKTELSRWVVENDTREEIVIPELSWRYLNQTRDLVSYVQYPSVTDREILEEDSIMNILAKSQVGSSYPFLMGFFNKRKKSEEIDSYGIGPEHYMIHSICRCEGRKSDELCLDSQEERILARKEFANDFNKILHRRKMVQKAG